MVLNNLMGSSTNSFHVVISVFMVILAVVANICILRDHLISTSILESHTTLKWPGSRIISLFCVSENKVCLYIHVESSIVSIGKLSIITK